MIAAATELCARWMAALSNVSWSDCVTCPLWLASGVALGFCSATTEQWPPPLPERMAEVCCAFLFGVLSIIESRPETYGRRLAGWVAWFVLTPRRWVAAYDDVDWAAFGPGLLRFAGSASVGFGVGLISWSLTPSVTAAFVVGLVVAVCLWVWTLYLFPDMDD